MWNETAAQLVAIGWLFLIGPWSNLAAGAESTASDVPSFVRDVVPVLTKAGCNAGACHGSFQGRGGFRLSLLGFDPVADYHALVLEARGRRAFPAAPEQSLILRKPTLVMPHGGGRRFDAEAPSYRILRDWIAAGMPGPGNDDPRLERLVVTSDITQSASELLLAPRQRAALQVRAVWSNGVEQDVTAWALYESMNDKVAEVAASGIVTAHESGRASVTIRHLGQVGVVSVSVPYDSNDSSRTRESSDRSLTTPATHTDRSLTTLATNDIGRLVADEWRKLGLRPAPLADDAEFLRRVSLDLIGTLPTVEQVRRFLSSTEPDKRAKLIDELLERSEYVDYWALKWSDLLRAHRRSLGEKGLSSFSNWLKQSLRENKPADRLVGELLTSQGNLFTNGPVAFYYVDQTPQELAETTAQVFLGVRLQCAKCHHHPYEVWSQDDYYGLAAFFARVQRKDTKENGRYGGALSVRLGATGKVTNPVTGETVMPRVFGQPADAAAMQTDPRRALAQWIVDKNNPYFARNVVNRYWGHLFGRGLVEPIDDLRTTNPPSHPALFDALAKDFTQHDFDLKHLLRTICNSRVYQLASEVAPSRDQDALFLTHRRPRRLSAEVLLDAINQAAGVVEKFDEGGRGRFGVASIRPGTRAIALPDPTVNSYFLEVFGRPNRTSACECDRGSRPDLSQALHLVNSEKIQAKVCDAQGRAAQLLAAKKSDDEIIEELYLATFGRLPNEQDQVQVRTVIASSPSREQGIEDLLWALLNSAEFVCNH